VSVDDPPEQAATKRQVARTRLKAARETGVEEEGVWIGLFIGESESSNPGASGHHGQNTGVLLVARDAIATRLSWS
jgi:hypothetical protein